MGTVYKAVRLRPLLVTGTLLVVTMLAVGQVNVGVPAVAPEPEINASMRGVMTGVFNKWTLKNKSGPVFTNSTSLTTMPGMRLDFSVTNPGSILIQFCVQMSGEATSGAMMVQPRLEVRSGQPRESTSAPFPPDPPATCGRCRAYRLDHIR
jgi:hypothetical protein